MSVLKWEKKDFLEVCKVIDEICRLEIDKFDNSKKKDIKDSLEKYSHCHRVTVKFLINPDGDIINIKQKMISAILLYFFGIYGDYYSFLLGPYRKKILYVKAQVYIDSKMPGKEMCWIQIDYNYYYNFAKL